MRKPTIRYTLLLFIVFVTKSLFAQHKKSSPGWAETKFISVKLNDPTREKKIVAVEIGAKATIYLRLNMLRQNAIDIKDDFNNEDVSKIISILDSSSKFSDTIHIDNYLSHFDYLVSQQLQSGNALVYYKKIKSFVPVISHRLEKYGMYAHRFFYLPDKRPFYSTMEYSGIIENNKYFSDPNELVKLGEKLAGLSKE
ncbi:MAG: hypothetical protein KF746_22755 [Chitinophagaceae bacterium]|nr:hypothetical protein [Chitinophagaceae bacterium]